MHMVSADRLGTILLRHNVSLVILSACQSAAVGREKVSEDIQPQPAMGSVAVGLAAVGIPSVLAMTYSVLVQTTYTLFGVFYKELAHQKSVGEAIDQARRYLADHPQKYEVQRGPHRVPFKLHDWFLPALYQRGADKPLLEKSDLRTKTQAPRSNVPKAPESGFFGRKRQLWEIERWFSGPTRRITIMGFGGQGKTMLAQEAGRWLIRTGLFDAAVFVDYSRMPVVDTVSLAKNQIGTVLNQTFVDASEVTAALRQTPTLVILDSLEALDQESLHVLLDATVPWSEAGGSRVLCTTRQPDFGHTGYKIEGAPVHRRIRLDGLGSKLAPDDALEWWTALTEHSLPPSIPAPQREALIDLFDRVRFHPLSIRVLTEQLKSRHIAEIESRLDELLTQTPPSVPHREPYEIEGTPAGLVASLELSLDRLDTAARKVLPRLGIFRGGAFEDDLVRITGLGDPLVNDRDRVQRMLALLEAGKVREATAMGLVLRDEDTLEESIARLRAELTKTMPVNIWLELRRQLEASALIEMESISHVRALFVSFHPSLAPTLWVQLDSVEREGLKISYRRCYENLALYLNEMDHRDTYHARAIAWRELPNLLHAAETAIVERDPNAVDFAFAVIQILDFFALKQEAERLTARLEAPVGGEGSREWYLVQVNRGQRLIKAGQFVKAVQVFEESLMKLGGSPTYERASILKYLGACFNSIGRPDLAAEKIDDAMATCDELESTSQIKFLLAGLLRDKGDSFAARGLLRQAQQIYFDSLATIREIGGDRYFEAAVIGQLGTLAMREDRLAEAEVLWRANLALIHELGDPVDEAAAWHQLGRVLELAHQWDEAERHYRESARIREECGDLAAAVGTWNQLGLLNMNLGKFEAAEAWFRNAIAGGQRAQNVLLCLGPLRNFGFLLQTLPGRLAEARQVLEQALSIQMNHNPAAEEIWTICMFLAETEEKEIQTTLDLQFRLELQAKAREHRQLARLAKSRFVAAPDQLEPFVGAVHAMIAACGGHVDALRAVHELQVALRRDGPSDFATSLDRILTGERDELSLCENLKPILTTVVNIILVGLADPTKLSGLLPPVITKPG
jgi:tetratricopeptide (TPR) repeat protein